MKTFTLTSFLLLFSVCVFAQTQRLVILEHFTQASCGPCATYNPAINAMLAANPNTVIALKYQTSWPGVDPMNAQNPSEVANRVSYYNVTGVPRSVIDGNYYNGHPSSVNINFINNRASVPSPFNIELNHSLSPNLDSVYVTATVTATQTIAEPLVLRMAVIEKQISFLSPPGTNGETVFHSVMKKMLPSVNGTTLPPSMNSGDQVTITESWKLANIYDLNQVAAVAFVQNTTSKEVHQSAISYPQALALDAGVVNISSLPSFQCTNSISPIITIKNYGANTLTSATIYYDAAGNAGTIPWTGSLASGATTTVSLPTLNVPLQGTSYYLFVEALNPNNGTDLQAANNSFTKNFNIYYYSLPGPVTEGFSSTTFPPADWSLVNGDNGPTWTRVTNAGGFGSSSQSARMYFYASPPGQIDELYLRPIDLRYAQAPINLEFNVAYAQYQAENDRLEVLVSTNCGTTWNSLYNKAGSTLSTASPTTSNFVPSASQWRAETVDLSPYLGQEVLMKFKATSAYGNNLFIDDLNIPLLTEMGQPVEFATDLNIYPNPLVDNATISFSLKNSQKIEIKVFNNLGELVINNSPQVYSAGDHTLKLNGAGLEAGSYLVTMSSEEGTTTRKMTIIK